jgi:DNA-binding transcriptional LysR family regulator
MGAIHADFDITARPGTAGPRGASAANLMPPSAENGLRSRLKMRHVQLLVAVDVQRSIHKAAAQLGMTQPAATRLLADLEAMLGLVLFERTTRGIIPTPQGASLVRHARAILGTLDHASEELDAIDAGATGKLTIGVLLVVAPVLLPRALLQFKSRNPRISVEVREGTLGSLLPLLFDGGLDLVVGRLTADFDAAGLHFEHCYDEAMTVVVRRGHPLCSKRGLRLRDLATCAWIVPTPQSAYRRRMDAAFRQGGFEPPPEVVESMSILTNTALLQESDMLGVMPVNVARYYQALDLLDVLDVALPPPSGPVGIITRAARAGAPALDDLVDALRDSGRTLADNVRARLAVRSGKRRGGRRTDAVPDA